VTEAEWRQGSDPEALIRFLRGRASDRKWRLFAVACCRTVGHLLDYERCQAVDVAERFADGLADRAELDAARAEVSAFLDEAPDAYDAGAVSAYAVFYAVAADFRDLQTVHLAAEHAADAFAIGAEDSPQGDGYVQAWIAAHGAVGRRGELLSAAYRAYWDLSWHQARRRQCDLLRDLFGNPLAPVRIEPAWRGWNESTVARLARAIYLEERFEDLAILADALEEAGCSDADVLAHCRAGGEHVRGCWLLDALIGKG
jgi:hypothetical protein